MKRYDISQEVFNSRVFPGDPTPEKILLSSMDRGDAYNLTAFSMCAHNGTHLDAPFHFFPDGRRIEQIDLSKVIGPAFVWEHTGILSGRDAEVLLKKSLSSDPEAAKRILIKGFATVSEEAAEVFASLPLDLIGNESQTVGPEDAPARVHRILLEKNVVLLEGLRLSSVPMGKYLLFAAPLNLSGADGAPCRAVLVDLAQREK